MLRISGLIFFVLLKQTEVNGQDDHCTNLTDVEFTSCYQDLAKNFFCSLNEEQQSWIKSLWEAAIQEKSMPVRKRREIRMLTDSERLAYFKAVDELKNDTTIQPNKYDTLALIHSNHLLCSVHRGSNFLGWHRIYLLLFETAVRQKDPSIVLPYWDSVLDNHNLTDSEQTVIFSEQFYGNGIGTVVSGPFSHWRGIDNCSLWRNATGEDGAELPSPSIIDMIEYDDKLHHVAQVIDHIDSHADQIKTIEGQHNLPHEWVGGLMDVLNSSSRDPIFFSHHAFIDYVWEQFRQKQVRLGENPEFYPAFGKISNRNNEKYNLTAFHTANRTMDCFSWMTNKDGYLEDYVGILYEYEDSPTCPKCGNSKYLTCSHELNRCIGITPLEQMKSDEAGNLGAGYILLIVIAVLLPFVMLTVFVILKKIRQQNVNQGTNQGSEGRGTTCHNLGFVGSVDNLTLSSEVKS